VKRARASLVKIGWREWVALPELGIDRLKAKVDTGAATSALHAVSLRTEERDGLTWLRFVVHPVQRKRKPALEVGAFLADERSVRSSSGHVELRPVIETELLIGGRSHRILLTLTNRKDMGYRMLLGRDALRGRFSVDVSASFLLGKPQ